MIQTTGSDIVRSFVEQVLINVMFYGTTIPVLYIRGMGYGTAREQKEKIKMIITPLGVLGLGVIAFGGLTTVIASVLAR